MLALPRPSRVPPFLLQLRALRRRRRRLVPRRPTLEMPLVVARLVIRDGAARLAFVVAVRHRLVVRRRCRGGTGCGRFGWGRGRELPLLGDFFLRRVAYAGEDAGLVLAVRGGCFGHRFG